MRPPPGDISTRSCRKAALQAQARPTGLQRSIVTLSQHQQRQQHQPGAQHVVPTPVRSSRRRRSRLETRSVPRRRSGNASIVRSSKPASCMNLSSTWATGSCTAWTTCGTTSMLRASTRPSSRTRWHHTRAPASAPCIPTSEVLHGHTPTPPHAMHEPPFPSHWAGRRSRVCSSFCSLARRCSSSIFSGSLRGCIAVARLCPQCPVRRLSLWTSYCSLGTASALHPLPRLDLLQLSPEYMIVPSTQLVSPFLRSLLPELTTIARLASQSAESAGGSSLYRH